MDRGLFPSADLRTEADTLTGTIRPPDTKRVASKDIGRDIRTANIEIIDTATPVKHGLGRKPSALNPLVPMVSGRLYFTQDDWERRTDTTVYVRGTAIGSYPMEVL
ncbi:MAG: hypothetical protein WC551_10595 [Patescibacteria group bacterium]